MEKKLTAFDLQYRFRIKCAVVEYLSQMHIHVQRLNRQDRRKTQKKVKRASTSNRAASFGVPLDTVVNRTGVQLGAFIVPRCLVQIANIVRNDLSTEGIFRVCGSAARIKSAQADIDAGRDVNGGVHDVAGLLKQFLRDLPEPLLTYRLYMSFIQAYQLPDTKQRIDALLLLCLELPESNLSVLGFLMQLLRDVAQSQGSRMTVFNLAAVFKPNLLQYVGDMDATTASDLELEHHSMCVSIVELLIENCDKIAFVPSHVASVATSMPSEEKARKEYRRIVCGEKPWWTMLFIAKLKVRKNATRQSKLANDAIHEPGIGGKGSNHAWGTSGGGGGGGGNGDGDGEDGGSDSGNSSPDIARTRATPESQKSTKYALFNAAMSSSVLYPTHSRITQPYSMLNSDTYAETYFGFDLSPSSSSLSPPSFEENDVFLYGSSDMDNATAGFDTFSMY